VYNSRIPFFIANEETNEEKLEKYTNLLKFLNYKTRKNSIFHFSNLGEIMTKYCKNAPNFGNFVIIEISKKIGKFQ
jgi:hypothetical protein